MEPKGGLKLESSLSFAEALNDMFLLTVLCYHRLIYLQIHFSLMNNLLKYLACFQLSYLLYMFLSFLYVFLFLVLNLCIKLLELL